MLDVEKLDHASDDLAVGHILEIHSLAVRLAAKPDLLEIGVQLLDDVVPLLLELGDAFLLGESEDLLVHLCPELNTPGGKLVDRLSHLGHDGDNTTGFALVGMLPLMVTQTGGIHDGLLGSLAGVRLLGNHHATAEQASVVRHGRISVLGRPGTGEVGVCVIGTAEAAASNQDDVLEPSNASVHGKDGRVEIFVRVVTTTSATGPLHDDGEGWVRLGDVDDGLDSLAGAGLERDVLEAQGLDVLLRHLDGWDTGTDRETFNGDTLGPEASEERDLPAHGTGVDIDEVHGDAAAGRNGLLNLAQGRRHSLGVIVTSTSQLNVVAGVHSGGHKVPWDGRRRHASDDERWETCQSAELGVDIRAATRRLYEPRAVLLDPIHCVLDSVLLVPVEQLGLVSGLGDGSVHGTGQNDANASSLLVAAGQDAKAGDTAGSEVNDVSGSGEGGRLLPVYRVAGDESDQGRDDVTLDLVPNILSAVGVVDGDAEVLGIDVDVLEVGLEQHRGLGKVLAVEGGRDGQESVDKPKLPLCERDPRLLKTGGGLDLSQSRIETVEGARGAGDHQVPGAVDQGNRDLLVGLAKIVVGLLDVFLDLGLGKISDAQHGCRRAFAIVDRVPEHGRRHGRSREGLLAARTNPKENGQGRLGDRLVGFP